MQEEYLELIINYVKSKFNNKQVFFYICLRNQFNEKDVHFGGFDPLPHNYYDGSFMIVRAKYNHFKF